jgi:hypothetical protein
METKRIEELDKNFLSNETGKNETEYYNVLNGPFQIYGLPWNQVEMVFYRLPYELSSKLSENLRQLAGHTSGVRVRFVTDSPFVSVRAELTSGYDMSHMPRTGISGFDFYVGQSNNRRYVKTIMPEYGVTKYEGTALTTGTGLQEWLIHFPLYNGIKQLEIGLKPNTLIKEAAPYTISKPIVFYGSSITQGGCASRPGNSYPNIISRHLDADIYCLGFSGSAKGEPEMADFISGLDMSLLVMDYDYNAPSYEHLANTHEPFFKIIRSRNKELPIVFVTRPNFDTNMEDSRIRRNIIYRTYINAVDAGDKNVYFIDGESLFGTSNRDSCTVDGCHPNDLGFMRMAETIGSVLRKILL